MAIPLINRSSSGRGALPGRRRSLRVTRGLRLFSVLIFSWSIVQGQTVPASAPVPTATPLAFTDVSVQLAARIMQGAIEPGKKAGVKNPVTVLKVANKKATIRYAISNPQVLPQFSTSFPLHLNVALKKDGKTVEIKSVSIKSVGRWRLSYAAVVDTTKTPQLKALADKVQELNATVLPNLKGRIDDQNVAAVMSKYKETRNLLESIYSSVKDDRDVLGAMLELKRQLEAEQLAFFHNKLVSEDANGAAHRYLQDASIVEKRFYRLNDNYRPEIYDMIRRECASSVGIVRIGTDNPLGSGVLIAKNLVLTCRHNIRENTARSYPTSEYVVWFNFEERRWPPEIKTVVYDCFEVYRSKTLDFSLLEIKPQHDPVSPEPSPIPISMARVERWTPIFLVGHPQGIRRIVHDGAWVLFPYKLMSNQERGELESEIAEDFVDWSAAGEVTEKTEWGLLQAQEFTEDCYGPRKNDSAVEYHYMKGDQPSMGAECDTFKGDSGAPAILRDTGNLAGILYKGLDDIPGQTAAASARKPTVSTKPGAKYHELILPISVIVEDMRRSFPRYEQYGVQFAGNSGPSTASQ